MPPVDGPCEAWTTEMEVRECCAGLDAAYDLTGVIDVASAVLFRLSGRRFTGECAAVIRPCATGLCDSDWRYRGWGYWPMLPEAPPMGYSGCRGTCGLDCLRLPGPIIEITEVKLDGAVFTDWVVSGSYAVCRTDGSSWPCTQDLSLAPTEDNTFQITYVRGRPVPDDGVWAASRLACELAKAACGSEGCELPQRARSIARRGVTIEMADNVSAFGEGLTGLRDVDLWLASVNPARIGRRARVTRPDNRRRFFRLS